MVPFKEITLSITNIWRYRFIIMIINYYHHQYDHFTILSFQSQGLITSGADCVVTGLNPVTYHGTKPSATGVPFATDGFLSWQDTTMQNTRG